MWWYQQAAPKANLPLVGGPAGHSGGDGGPGPALLLAPGPVLRSALVSRILVIVAVVLLATMLGLLTNEARRLVHLAEDRVDVPGIHDCWGLHRHTEECS